MINSKGFTLVEVLIAAVILFSALAITADLYKASSFTAEKITKKSSIYQATPIVISTLKTEVLALSKQEKLAQYSGQLISGGVEYEWNAQRTSFKSRVQRIDESFPPPLQFGLYQIDVSAIQYGEVKERFSFKVATW